MIASLLVPMALFGITAWTTWRAAQADAEAKADRIVRVAEEHITRILDTAESVIGRVDDLLGTADAAQIRAREREFHERLRQILGSAGQLQGVFVLGPDGKALVGGRMYPMPSSIDAADREFFTWHRRGANDVYVSAAIRGRTTRERSIAVSRRRLAEDGSFGGVIVVAVDPVLIADFYQRIARREPGLVVSLVRSDGGFLTRWPPVPDDAHAVPQSSQLMARFASRALEGVTMHRSPLDGKRRLAAFRRVGDYDLYAIAGINEEAILAGWSRTVALLAAFAFPSSAALLAVSWVALRRARREGVALRRLRAEVDRRNKAEDALRQAQKLEAIGRLTGGVAHDFNNLLMVVNSNAHLLARLVPASATSAPLAAIRRAVTSGERLTRQLLSFARRQALRPEVIDLRARMPMLRELIEPAVGARVRIQEAVAADVAPVVVDVSELELAVLNLAINARDAMPHGGTLTVFARNASAAELPDGTVPHVVLGVSDTGTGIPLELQERVFEPFFTTKASGRGTGLGLSQVYGLCAQAGGVARLDSTPGRGTTVLMLFPASAEPVTAEPGLAPSSRLPSGLRVLLVEDDPDVAAATVPLLQGLGCAVCHLPDGDSALERLAVDAAAFDVVLSDVVMPGRVGGIGLAMAVAERHAGLPVLLMTGYTAELDRARAQGLRVVAKPCAPDTLVAAIAEVTRPPVSS